MIYSRSSEYAIRACTHLANVPDGKCAMVKHIAKRERIPAHFLAKILQDLARKGLLRSAKGPSGGFCLNVPSSRLRLIDIVSAVDGLDEYDRCVAGYARCSDAAPCAMHEGWRRLRSRIMEYLGGNFIGDLARATTRQTGSKPARSAVKRTGRRV